ARLPSYRRVELSGADLEAALLPGWHDHRHRAGQRHLFRVADPVRRGNDGLIARLQQHLADAVADVLGAIAGDDLLRTVVKPPVVLFQPVRDGLTQLGDAADRRILGE